jgi:hypothetical protein
LCYIFAMSRLNFSLLRFSDKENSVRKCPVCGSPGKTIGALNPTHDLHLFTDNRNALTLDSCRGCGLIYTSPLLPKEVLYNIYPATNQFTQSDVYTGPRAEAVKEYFEWRFNAVLKKLNFKNEHLKILEIGAGLSWMCQAAKKKNSGFLTVADDLTPEAKGLCTWVDHYYIGDLISQFDHIRKYGPYNIISMTHVIEHLPDPIDCLNLCRALLCQNGIVFITSPHRPRKWNGEIDAWKSWVYNHVPGHIQYFNKTSLKKLAGKTQLKIAYFDASIEEGQALECSLSPV